MAIRIDPPQRVLRKREGLKVPSFQGRDLRIGRGYNIMIILLIRGKLSNLIQNFFQFDPGNICVGDGSYNAKICLILRLPQSAT